MAFCHKCDGLASEGHDEGCEFHPSKHGQNLIIIPKEDLLFKPRFLKSGKRFKDKKKYKRKAKHKKKD